MDIILWKENHISKVTIGLSFYSLLPFFLDTMLKGYVVCLF